MSEKIVVQGTLTITEPTFKKKGSNKNADWKLYKFKHDKRTYSTFVYPASDNWNDIEDWVDKEIFGSVTIELRPLADGSGTYPSRLFAPDDNFLQTGSIPEHAENVCDLEDAEEGKEEPAQQPEKATESSNSGKQYGGHKGGDLRTYALGSSARIIASMSQALDVRANIEYVEKAWDKLYEFALAKLSDSPQKSKAPEPSDRAEEEDPKRSVSTLTPEEQQKIDAAAGKFKAEIIDFDQPVDESGIKDRDKTNKKLDMEVQIQDLEKKLKFNEGQKSNFRGACKETSDYLKFLQSMAVGKGIKVDG